ncbi:hypothetical protein BsWGS_12711 [Bradybaena similaris]
MATRQETTVSLGAVGSWLAVMFMSVCVSLAGTAKIENDSPSPFRVVWNYPDMSCVSGHIDMELSKHGIVANNPRDFVGNEVATLYPNFGLWPMYLDKDGTRNVNEGLPQLANLTAHLDKLRKDIADKIPAASTGYAAFDQEAWRPLYDYNWGNFKVYKYASMKVAKQKHGTGTRESVAREEFSTGARKFMEQSLMAAREIRPETHWGYYGYPPYWSEAWANNKMGWLFKASTGIYPSIYIKDPRISHSAMKQAVESTLNEAFRLRAAHGHPNTPIVAYTAVQAGDFFSKDILDYAIGLPAEMGVEGVIIWGSSANFKPNPVEKCNGLKKYVNDVLGPYVSQLLNRFANCSTSRCGGHGKCVKKDYAQHIAKSSLKRQAGPVNIDDNQGERSDQRHDGYRLTAGAPSNGNIKRDSNQSNIEQGSIVQVDAVRELDHRGPQSSQNTTSKLWLNCPTGSIRKNVSSSQSASNTTAIIGNLTRKGFNVQYTGHTLRGKLIDVKNYYFNLTHKQNNTTSVKFNQPKSSNMNATGLSLKNPLLLHNDSSTEGQQMSQKRATSQWDKSDSSTGLQTREESVKENTANQTSTAASVGTENNKDLGPAPVSVDTTVSHQYDDYVCQCYSQYRGDFCEETNSV